MSKMRKRHLAAVGILIEFITFGAMLGFVVSIFSLFYTLHTIPWSAVTLVVTLVYLVGCAGGIVSGVAILTHRSWGKVTLGVTTLIITIFDLLRGAPIPQGAVVGIVVVLAIIGCSYSERCQRLEGW